MSHSLPTLTDILDEGTDQGVFPPSTGAALDVLADRYALIDEVGRGGMGIVYRARDHELGEMVALKMLKPELAERTAMVDLLRREVRLARRLTHPNIVRVHDLGNADGQRFMTMELIVGPSLRQRLDAGPLALHEVWGIFRQIATGLSAAHRRGVLHRDLKPENVLLDEVKQRVVLTDFGVADLEFETMHHDHGSLVGTPRYMAPEQRRGEHVDHRADLFSVGAMLEEALKAGGVPTHDPLHAVASACLATDPAGRPADVGALARALDAARPPDPSSLPERDAPRVLIMPLTAQPGAAWAAAGLVEMLTQRLGGSAKLRLCPLPATTSDDEATLVRAFDADVVVRGTATGTTDSAVIDMEVEGVKRTSPITSWHERRTVAPRGLGRLSSQMAESIAAHLGVTLPRRPPPGRHTPLPSSLTLGQQGRRRLEDGWFGDLEPAIALLQEALVQDPAAAGVLADYALASARQAFYEVAAAQMLIARALRAAKAAVRIRPADARAWYALGYARLQSEDRSGAAAALARAVQWSPNMWGAQSMLAELLLDAGAIEPAALRLEAVLDIDPGNERARMELARIDGLMQRFDDARSRLATPPERSGRALHAWLVERVALWAGSTEATPFDEAALRRAAPEVGPLVTLVGQIRDIRMAGDWTPALRDSILAAPRGMPARVRAVKLQCAAEVAGHLGHSEEAVDAIERATADQILHDLSWIDHCAALACVRAHPTFSELRQRVARGAHDVLAAARTAGLEVVDSAA